MKSMLGTRFLFILFLFFLGYSLPAQTFEEINLASSGGSLELVMAEEASPYLVCGGSFGGTLEINAPNDTTKHTAQSRFNAFVSKVDSLGEILWVRPFLGECLSEVLALEVDDKGNIYCLGRYYHDDFDADPGPNKMIMKPIGGGESFLIKLDPQGHLIWAKQFGGNLNDVSLDSKSNIFLGGMYYNKIDLNPGLDSFIIHTPKQGDGYVVKLDPNGDFQWGRVLGDFKDEITEIELDSEDQIIAAGFLTEPIKTKPGIRHCFLSKLNNSDGTTIWENMLKSDKKIEIEDLQVGPNNSIYLTGQFESSFTYEGQKNKKHLKSKGGEDAYILKLNSEGEHVWSKQIAEGFVETSTSIFIDRLGRVHWSGTIIHQYFINEKTFYQDYNLLLIFLADGKLWTNNNSGKFGSDYGFKFCQGSQNYSYYFEKLTFKAWVVKRFW